MEGDVRLLHELDGVQIPTRRRPENLLFAAVLIDFVILVASELDFVAVLHVCDIAPWGLTAVASVLGRHAQFGIPLLKLYGVATCADSDVNQTFGDIEVAVVVQADFRNDKNWRAVSDSLTIDLDEPRHRFAS